MPKPGRQLFWRHAASVALGRTQAGVAYKQWLQSETILAAVEDELDAELQLQEDLHETCTEHAGGIKRDPEAAEDEPEAKRRCTASSASSASTSSSCVPPLDAATLRRMEEMKALQRQCDLDLVALRAQQLGEFERFVQQQEEKMAQAKARFQRNQTEQLLTLEKQNVQHIAELRSKHLKEIFAPCLWISAADGQDWHGFYMLSTQDSTDVAPVYCKYGSDKPFLFASGAQWWFSSRQNMFASAPCGFVHSTCAGHAAPNVIDASGWKMLGPDRTWHATDLRLVEVRSPVEFVVVSLAGEEILRKACSLEETVGQLRKDLQEPSRRHQTVLLCLNDNRLRKSTPLGCLNVKPGEPLQAVFMLRKCLACKNPIDGPPSRCGSCGKCHCRPCSRRLTRCWRCGKRVCRNCAAEVGIWFFMGMCPRCAQPPIA